MNTIINFFRIGLLIAAVQILSSASCNKDGTSCLSTRTVYSFIVTSEWSPQKEVYNISDAILLTSTFSKSLTDLANPSLTINYSNSTGIGGNITIYKLDTILKQVEDAADKFDYHALKGELKTSDLKPSRIKDTYYEEVPSSYNLIVSITAKEKGIYAIFISDLLSRGISGENCTKANFVNTLTNTNKNVNLFQHAIGRPPASQYEIDRIYCFRVQ